MEFKITAGFVDNTSSSSFFADYRRRKLSHGDAYIHRVQGPFGDQAVSS
jgi:hypothetical protein